MDSMEKRLKTALITGALSGLGPAYTEYFATLGYALIVTGKEKKSIRIFAEDIEKNHHVSVMGLAVDLSDRKGLTVLQRQIDFVCLDALVNNAADEDWGADGWADSSETKRLTALQMNTAVSLTLSVLRRMINRNDGVIINVSPDGGYRSAAGTRMQISSKIFIRQFTEGLSAQLTDTGIRVQAVCPGTIGPIIAMMGVRPDKRIHAKGIITGSEPREIVETAMRELEQGRILYSYTSRHSLFSKRSEYFAG